MSRDEPTPWASEVLRRMQAATEPRSEDRQRVLSAVERQLGIDTGPSLPEAQPTRSGARSSPGAGELVRDAVSKPLRSTGWIPGVSLRAAGWGVFGLATGVCGYFWGYARGSDDVASRVASVVSVPLPTPAGAARAAPSEGLPSLPERSAPPFAAPSSPMALAPTRAPAPRATNAQGPESSPPMLKRPAAMTGVAAERSRPHRGATAGVRSGSGLREALALLGRAEASLRNGNPDFARALLDELDEKSPVTPLTEERLITRALVSCALGDVGAARESRQELERLNSDSIYRRRLDGSCAAPAPTTPDESPASMSDSPSERH